MFKLDNQKAFLSYSRKWVLLSFLVGIVCGILMIGFYFSISFLQYLFATIPVYFSMIIGGIVTALFVKFRKGYIQGSGIPYYINCRRGTGNIKLKDVGENFITSTASLGSGCIVGKESSAVFMGGGIALWIARLLKFPSKKRHLTLTIGGAAATSAIFQAPLGGAIFAAEIPYRHDLDAPEYMPSFLASLTSYFTFRYGLVFITGEIPHLLDFNIGGFLNTPTQLLCSFTVGIVTGLLGVLFVHSFHFARERFATIFKPEFAIMIGISLTALGSYFILFITKEDISFAGTGFHILNYIENEQNISITFLAIILVGTFLASSLTVGMGVSGGVFGPSLVIGGCAGGIVGHFLDPANISAYIVIGMSAVHTASTKTPIASLILIMEMTGFPPIFIGMVIANIAAFFVSGNKSLYTGQISDRLEELVERLGDMEILALLKVEDIMQGDTTSLYEEQSVFEAKRLITKTRKHSIPIVDKSGKLRGIITLNDLKKKEDKTPIKQILSGEPVSVTPDTSIKDSLSLLFESDVKGVPVVDKDQVFIGVVTIKNLIHSYRQYVKEN